MHGGFFPWALLALLLQNNPAALHPTPATPPFLEHAGQRHALYPAVTATCPDLPSPLTTAAGREYVIVRLHDGTFGVVDVTRAQRPSQLEVDAADFPTLARTGRHAAEDLDGARTITGRSVEEITALARPGALSVEGFLAEDEDIVAVLSGDNALVTALDLTHAELARPLFHVWNLMQTDIDLGRWNMAHHRWENVTALRYHGNWVLLDAHDTKGGQKSPFADDLEGGFWIVIRRPLDAAEEAFLHGHYAGLGSARWNRLSGTLTRIFTGEMEPYYVQWYGFYEGHTDWRVDPLAIARVFGLRTLAELEKAFPGQLADVVSTHYTAPPGSVPARGTSR